MIKVNEESIQLQTETDKDAIKQLRNSRPTTSDDAEDGSPCVTQENEVIDNETYLQCMAVDRNWEIPRERLIISDEKLGGGEFGIVNKGAYLRTDENKLPVAVKRLKGLYRLRLTQYCAWNNSLLYVATNKKNTNRGLRLRLNKRKWNGIELSFIES